MKKILFLTLVLGISFFLSIWLFPYLVKASSDYVDQVIVAETMFEDASQRILFALSFSSLSLIASGLSWVYGALTKEVFRISVFVKYYFLAVFFWSTGIGIGFIRFSIQVKELESSARNAFGIANIAIPISLLNYHKWSLFIALLFGGGVWLVLLYKFKK
ncbi:MAG: hypothetical protein AABZ00_18300 [Chloroflexota bacterium]